MLWLRWPEGSLGGCRRQRRTPGGCRQCSSNAPGRLVAMALGAAGVEKEAGKAAVVTAATVAAEMATVEAAMVKVVAEKEAVAGVGAEVKEAAMGSATSAGLAVMAAPEVATARARVRPSCTRQSKCAGHYSSSCSGRCPYHTPSRPRTSD